MNENEITVGTRIKDTTTGRVFTVIRIPNARKKSFGVTAEGSTMERFVYRNELPRFVVA
jgi:hypothetical protein